MATNKKYDDPQEVLRQAVGKSEANMNNDYDGDGHITAADARGIDNHYGSFGNAQTSGQQNTGRQSLTDGYLQQANEYLNAYKNNKFNYDLYNDPVYQQARDAYIKQGQQASKNVSAQAAGLTGGYGNSYGATAAQQQYNAALSQLNDIVPDLENAAYAKYQNDQAKNMNLAQMYLDLENQQYNREYNEAQLAAQYGDYTGLNNRGIDTSYYEGRLRAEDDYTDWERDRNKTLAQQADEDREYNRTWNEALQRAQYGDYSGLQALGLDTSTQEKRDLINLAVQWAEYGDYSLLEQLGIDTSYLNAMQAAQLAAARNSGKSSGSGSSGSSGSSSSASSTSSSGNDDEDDTDKESKESDSEKKMTAVDKICKELGITTVGTTATGYVAVDSNGDYYDIIIDPRVKIDEEGGIKVYKRETK